MRLVGLTGSIAMGKSTAAAMLKRLKVPVHDADATVHRLLGPHGAAVAQVEALFPGVASEDGVDRAELGRRVFGDPAALRRLEGVLHPLVREAEQAFLKRQCRQGCRLVVLDVPLLFETGGESRVDRVFVVSAPHLIQRQRALARPGMTGDRLAHILSRQVGDHEKRRRADTVLPTGLGRRLTLRVLKRALRRASRAPGRSWPPNAFRRSRHARNRP